MCDISCGRMVVHDLDAFMMMGGPREYTPYAVGFRYEGVGPDSEPIDRKSALRLEEMLLDEVRQRLAVTEGRLWFGPVCV